MYASTLSNSVTILSEDGAFASVTNAFQPPTAPQLTANAAGGNVTVSWVSPGAGFVLQQVNKLVNGNNWVDATNSPSLAGGVECGDDAVDPGRDEYFLSDQAEVRAKTS